MADTDLATMREQFQKKLAEASTASAGGDSNLWSPELVRFLTVSLLVFTALALLLCTALLYRKDQSGMQTLRVFGVILICCFSALLLIVGYNSEQLTPIIGLFGAIAGYLLGKDSNSSLPKPDNNSTQS